MNDFFSKHYFDCLCGDFGHTYRIVMDNETGELHIEIQFQRFTFWKRLGRAFKYVFGLHVDYGFYGETLIDPAHYDGLREVLHTSEERAKEYANEATPVAVSATKDLDWDCLKCRDKVCMCKS
jgi:hypothetical protein